MFETITRGYICISVGSRNELTARYSGISILYIIVAISESNLSENQKWEKKYSIMHSSTIENQKPSIAVYNMHTLYQPYFGG